MKDNILCGFYRLNSIFSAFLVGACISFSTGICADTSVWEIKSASDTLYLGGTVHLLRPGDYPLPDEYEQAYQAASEIYFETDLNSMSDMSVQVQLLQQLSYSDGRSFKNGSKR